MFLGAGLLWWVGSDRVLMDFSLELFCGTGASWIGAWGFEGLLGWEPSNFGCVFARRLGVCAVGGGVLARNLMDFDFVCSCRVDII